MPRSRSAARTRGYGFLGGVGYGDQQWMIGAFGGCAEGLDHGALMDFQSVIVHIACDPRLGLEFQQLRDMDRARHGAGDDEVRRVQTLVGTLGEVVKTSLSNLDLREHLSE